MIRRALPLAVFVTIPVAVARAEPRCDALAKVKLVGAVITDARTVPAGLFTPPPDGVPGSPVKLPAYCRVQGVARPTKDSEIRFEVWLPGAATWNGKYQQRGNGGYAGSIPSSSLADGLARGYATAGTDDGHVGQDPSFAPGHPEKVIDFGHRAVHETAVHAKVVVAAYYGRPASRSYFSGCSDGGREALMEAQRYPEDFEGIVVGAPANEWIGLLTTGVWAWRALNETPGSRIPVSKLPAIQRAVLASCDVLDRVKDGLIEDPRRCRFDPATLACKGPDGPGCLTAAQLTALRKIYDGPKNPRTGARIYPGHVPGTEAVNGNWDLWVVAGMDPKTMPPFLPWFGLGFYEKMVFEKSPWDYRTLDFDRDVATARTKLAAILSSDNPDLAAFRRRGGKLIQYHGWGDAAISATGSIDYYERVKATLGGSVEDFYRLFMVPGMGHCGGGIGPTNFGNGDFDAATAADPERDIHAALDRWVEKGIAPERIIATGQRPANGDTDFTRMTKLSRPLCVFPKIAEYQGSGSIDSAANFVCRVPTGAR